MIAQEVAKKYGKALYRSASERSLLDQGYEQFGQLRLMLKTDRKLLHFLSAPQIPLEEQVQVVRNVFGERFDRLFVEFLVVLTEKHRVNFLQEITDEFIRLVEEAKGIVRATAISAVPLSSSEKEKLVLKLAAKTGKQIELEEQVDRSIVGGLIVLVGGEIIDGSVRHGLRQIGEQLEKVRVH